ncbi:unnamed protein product [Gongylonema pulchrum]|uniref:Phosphoglycerate mutase family protein n=1 Tax=Gongylonema pulchrum TaxID=637853 RepID=A0A183DRP7_9BILA|nr:unnamed protein product [Gongylonema pulchrum]
MGAMTFWVVRHAEREDNISSAWRTTSKLKGDNSPLSKRGQVTEGCGTEMDLTCAKYKGEQSRLRLDRYLMNSPERFIRKPPLLVPARIHIVSTGPGGIPERTVAAPPSNDSSKGLDGINIELIRFEGHEFRKAMAIRFSQYLFERKIPSKWKESKMVLLRKMGDKDVLMNCLPLSLLIFCARIITCRLTEQSMNSS